MITTIKRTTKKVSSDVKINNKIIILFILLVFVIQSCSSPTNEKINADNPYVPLNEIRIISKTNLLQTTEIIKDVDLVHVTRVIDGDTIEVENGLKVRLICIDTPEIGQDYYDEAKNYLENLILNKRVALTRDISETDRYGRLLRYIGLGKIFVNGDLVRKGYAKVYRYPPDTSRCNELEELESIAKQEGINRWQNPNSVINTKVTNCIQLGCSQNANYVGSRKSDVYHECLCSYAKKIKPSNIVCFNSESEAISKGYRKAKRC